MALSIADSGSGSLPLTGAGGTLACNNACAPKDVIHVWVRLTNASTNAAAPTVSDSVNSGNYTPIGTPAYDSGSQLWVTHYYMVCNASGTPTITVGSCAAFGGTAGGNVSFERATGFAGNPSLDTVAVAASASGNNGSPQSASFTTNNNPEMLFAGCVTLPGNYTTSGAWSQDNSSINNVFTAYLAAASPAGTAEQWTGNTHSAGSWWVLTAGFSAVAAQFESDGTSKSTASGAPSTKIALASSGNSVHTALGFPGILVYSVAKDVSTGTGALSTSISPASDGRSTSTGLSTLTSWASVTLTAPLYTGRGSIVATGAQWSDGAPAAGDVVYYDPTYLTVYPDGSTSGTVELFSAVVLWLPGAGVASELVIRYSPFASVAGSVSTSVGSIVASTPLVSSGSSVVTGRASFTVSKAFASAGTSISTGIATGFQTAIRLSSAGRARSSGAASMLTAVVLNSHSTQRSIGVAAMTSAIALESRGAAVQLTGAAIFSSIALRSRGASVSTGAGELRQVARFTSAGRSVSIGKASLLTHLPLASRGAAVTTLTGTIQYGATFVSRGSSRSTSIAAATTGIALESTGASVSSGILFQIFPARFGYAVVTPLSQSGAQAAEQAYVAGSTVYVEVAYFDSNGVPFVPNVVTYNVTDVVSGVSLVNSTQVIPAESEIITIKGAQNYMVNLTRASEQHAIVVAVTDGFGNTGYGQATFDVVRPPGT